MATVERLCACGCGRAVAEGRKKYAGNRCARRTWKATERAGKAARRPGRPAAEPGTERGLLTYFPDHPIARSNGWVTTRRLRAYELNEGVARCMATGQIHEWPMVNVCGDELAVLCHAHTRVRSFGQWLVDSGFAGQSTPDLLARLTVLMATACQAEGSSASAEDARVGIIPPTTSGGGDVETRSPLNHGGVGVSIEGEGSRT